MASGEEYGPCLPPGLTPGVAEGKLSGKTTPPDDAPASYGPCLPPELVEREGGELSRTFGPALPPSDVRTSTAGEEENGEGGATGQLHVSEQEDEEAELIGPAVPGPDQQSCALQQIKESFESRSKAMQEWITGKDNDTGPRREEWMMELPPGFRIPGVGARKFQSQDRDLGDRSVWTDTPADRKRKKLEQLKKKEKQGRKEGRKEGGSGSGPAEQPVMSKRDREMEELAAEHNKGRTESLFSVHARKRLAGPREEERRPFDRERDLQISRVVPPSKRQDVMRDSSHKLHSKFTHSSQQKYL